VCVGDGVLIEVGIIGPALASPGVFAELRYHSPMSPRLRLMSATLLL
jgi:hypothetical protein